MPKVKMIKSDALIDIQIGTGFMQKLQQLLLFITKDVDVDEIKAYKDIVDAKIPFTEEWMEHLTVVSVLLKELEEKAEEQGFIYEDDIESSGLSEQDLKTEEN